MSAPPPNSVTSSVPRALPASSSWHLVLVLLTSALWSCADDASSPDAAADAVAPDADAAPTADAAATPDGTSGDPADAGPALPSLDDEFDGTALASAWQRFRPELLDLAVSDGALHLTPNQRVLWFDDSQGALLYKRVTGDFKASTVVRARRASDPAQAPTMTVHLGGIMARAPTAVGDGGQEDYVFIVAGVDVDDLSVEVKTTDDGSSTFEGPTWGSPDAALRLCRVGDEFRLYKRMPDQGAWVQAASYTRPDMPATVQVGPIAYANTDTPDLRASFDYVRFAPVSDLAGCTAD
ncbi:hypothetical protein [Haliangium sp.]|uniref:hypothetical protein n=1 Tax=Haliangium sp. TaxID=2663208 RepID=UPI003D10DDE7